MSGTILFDPILPWALLGGLAIVLLSAVALAAWRGLSGWWLRAGAALVVLLALVNPSYQHELRTPLSDIVVVIVDETASQRLSDRAGQTARALARIEAEVGALENTELRITRLTDDLGDGGTRLMEALTETLGDLPRDRLAGAILLTDGQVHDLENTPDLPAPLHALLSGRDSDWDRRLIVRNAPAFAILGEELMLTLRIEDQGAVPADLGDRATLKISIDGAEPITVPVPVNRDIELPLSLPHGGMNVLHFTLDVAEGELTGRNNAAVVQINAVRDRLRVLLVSGEPHPGERTWRNLLKSDSSVDLVHFTILRPPEKQDGVPVTELSLIAFPTRELFLEKIDEFDLIIFDRYKRRGILPLIYLDNVRDYVRRGGAVLIAAGPDFATANSLYYSSLAEILPAEPTARVLEEGFRPLVNDLGQRHPVTDGLAEDWKGDWGRWFRLIDLQPRTGQVVMNGPDARPLLVLDRVGEGRVALLASDHAWLWSRGYEGGGPQLELLRRLAHWMMKEPELEEEALTARAEGQTLTVLRRSLTDDPREVTITAPDGTVTVLPLREETPGRFTARYGAPGVGLYRLSDGELETVMALGPAAPREFESTIATDALLQEPVAHTRGGILRISERLPGIRRVRAGRVAAGRGWIGITPRQAYVTADVTLTPLTPPWLLLLLFAGTMVLGWLREGRR